MIFSVFKHSFGVGLLLSIVACSNQDEVSQLSNLSKNSKAVEFSALFQAQNKENLKEIITNSNVIQTRSLNAQNYVSLMDVVRDDDPLLSTYTNEEKQYIKDNNLTYYDVLGYDDAVPNEKFASLLNSRGEVQVGDSIYRITPCGTFSTNIANRKDIEKAYQLLQEGDSTLSAYPNVHFKLLCPDVCDLPEYNNVATRTAIEDIPYWTFPEHLSDSHTFFGKMFGKIFGDRFVKHYDFRNGYRIKGSLYDYDYGVYSEIGAYVASRKKRGGFFRKLNGWKGCNAEELTIAYRGIVLELDTKLPSELKIPERPTIVNTNPFVELPGVGNPIPCIDIMGLTITDQQIMRFAGKGLKEGLSELRKLLGKNVPNNTRAIRVLMPTKIYIIIMDNQINEYNVEQIRKVFNSSVKFFISSSILKNPLSFKATYDFLMGLHELPIKRMKAGEVILAGKINGRWGGLRISKH